MAKIKRNTGMIHRQYRAIVNAPDYPERVRNIRELFNEAVAQASVSGVVEPTYDKLPDSVKREYSFKTFERNVQAAI